jgi:formimidoylglutamase
VIPHTRPPTWPEPVSPSRFASRIRRDRPAGCAVALIGLPDDEGVRLNQGRPGAAEGPNAFRAALARLGAADPASGDWPSVFDAGDVVPGTSLEETHRRITEATRALLSLGLLPVAVGGGHDLTFPFVRAVAEQWPAPAGLYFDAHLDVRETRGSGMPFRKLVEECGVPTLHLHGFRPFVNTSEHLAWFRTHGGMLHPDGAEIALPQGESLFVSIDLDVLDVAHAPGVSATNPAGWTVRELEPWARASGADPRVRSFDLMELNPAFDRDGQTARAAAQLFLTFLAGFTSR